MSCLNKISPASPYLDDVLSGVDEGLVRVCVARFVGSLRILAVCVCFKESNWLAFGAVTSTSSSVLFRGMVRFLQLSRPVVMDCKPVLRGVMLQPMFLQRLLDLVSSGEWLLQSLMPGMARAFAGVPFLHCLFSVIFNLWRAAIIWRKKKASMIFNNHWSTYIVEEDFRFITASGLTAVRIPVGWWIASGPNPPAPYVGGSLRTLDNAFKWAETHNLGVIIDLHAAPGSQNPWEHSSSRDGTQEWGTTDASIAETVKVIDFLASRYAKSPSLLAVELMNEPLAPGASLDSLKKYYRDGYNAVRRHSPEAYVVMSNRLGTGGNTTELLGFAGGFAGAVLDVHYYTVFNDMFSNLTVQQNIDFIRTNFSSDLSSVTTANGPLTFVGEWVAEWKVPNATKEEYQKYAQAQLDVYGQATFGWSYWTLENVNNHWNLEWMINNGYISLKS